MPVQVNESEMWILPFLPPPTFPIIRPDDDDDRERERDSKLSSFKKNWRQTEGIEKRGKKRKVFRVLAFSSWLNRRIFIRKPRRKGEDGVVLS